MKYEIIYTSKTGSTEKVAYALAKMLPPSQCRIVNIDQEESSDSADVYLIGFGVQKGACPYRLLALLEKLEGKKMLFFATGGLAAFKGYQKKLEASITSFLPDNYVYLGLFLCQGKISQEGYAYLESCLNHPSDAAAAQNLKQLYTYSQSHPDEQDLQNACAFLKNALSAVD